MMKTICIVIIMLITSVLFSQEYTFERCTFNAAGGHQSNSQYSVTTAVAERVQGDVSNTDYTGYLGFLFPMLNQSPPMVTSIDDVPNDQGRQVQVVWNKCAFDDIYQFETYYSVWRFDEDFEVRTKGGRNGIQSTAKADSKQNKENVFTDPYLVIERYREDSNQTYFWQREFDIWTFIGEIPALQYDEYSYIAPTLSDASEVDVNASTFKVVFHDLYEFYESAPASGYSVDNIGPDETRAMITKIGNNMRLSWEEVEFGTFEGNRYPELNGIWYRIYAGSTPDFECDETTYLQTVTDIEFDFLIGDESMKFFRIVVSDKP
jgi:hypothetical protein